VSADFHTVSVVSPIWRMACSEGSIGEVNVATDLIQVLIVDDQEAFRSAARLVVDLSEGFELAGEADTGESGVRMASELTPDLVLMDMNLPGIDGLEATRQIIRALPGTRVIALSTYEEFKERALAAGAVAFISKSDFEPGLLVATWSAVRT
jgi:two-component system invasion response regulator UvrY